MNQLLEAALSYAEAGIPVLPLEPGAKNPLSRHGVKDATTDITTIKKWFINWPKANVGIATGHEIFGLDIDYKDGADPDFLKRIPPTAICQSPSGGHHAYFKIPPGGIKNGLVLEKGVTVRAIGYYFAAPPSYFSGTKSHYAWITKAVSEGGVEECPEWIVELNKKASEEKKAYKLPDEIETGNRDPELFKFACSLRAKGMEYPEILAALEIANARCSEPKSQEKLEEKARNACNYKKGVKKEISVEQLTTREGSELILPDKGAKGAIRGTIENVKALLNYLGIIVRYNVISKEEEILIPNSSFTVDNQAVAAFAAIQSECARYGIPSGCLGDQLSHIADKNLYNPVATWIESREWDGVSRLQEMFDTVVSPTKLKEVLMKKWFISAMAAIYNHNGVSAHGVLVFMGPQYIGKTKWFKNLAPQELGVLKDGAILHPDNKDSVFQVVSKWLVELGELDATFRKSDIAQLKGFLTKDQDVLRRAYARKESHYARRTVFFASVNEQWFLNDPTGNRRFWTIDCESINYDHGIDMQQFWAEIRQLYLKKEIYYLTQEEHEKLSKSNEEFHQVDPIEERIRDYYGWDGHDIVKVRMNASAVCIQIGISNPSRRDVLSAARAIQNISGQKAGRDREYEMPIKKARDVIRQQKNLAGLPE